jgi:hypothetical protein
MAGGTHAFDMIKRLRDNENLRKKNYFKTKDTYHRTSNSVNIDYKTATQEERKILRTKIIEEQTRETRNKIIVLIISTIVTVTLVILIIKFVLP